MFWPTITELSLLTRQILMKLFENLAWLGTKSVRFTSGKKRPQPAPLGCGLSTSATAETAAVLSFRRQSLQNCNDWQDKFFGGDHLTMEERKIDVKTTKAALITAMVAGLACNVAAQLKEQPGEVVELKSLPASVQQTIKQKTAGGEVVQVKREDDANGKWNYEVVVRTNGKESGFEVDPNGKLLRQHAEVKR